MKIIFEYKDWDEFWQWAANTVGPQLHAAAVVEHRVGTQRLAREVRGWCCADPEIVCGAEHGWCASCATRLSPVTFVYGGREWVWWLDSEASLEDVEAEIEAHRKRNPGSCTYTFGGGTHTIKG